MLMTISIPDAGFIFKTDCFKESLVVSIVTVYCPYTMPERIMLVVKKKAKEIIFFIQGVFNNLSIEGYSTSPILF
jgi:hypothetical protein